MASLESPLAKYNWAKEQADALSKGLSALCDLKSYTIAKDIDRGTGEEIYRFERVPSMPDNIGLRIGDMLHNFRCSLDHLVWQLVLSEGNMPTTRTEFPIFNDPKKYEREKSSKLKGVSNTVVSIIDALQPCNSTGPDDFWWYLWYLHILNIADKHRYLLLTRRTLAKKIRPSWTDDRTSTRIPGCKYLDVAVENGVVFLRCESGMDLKVTPTIQIRFSNSPPDIRKDLPVGTMIRFIQDSVDEVFKRLSPHVK